MMLTFTAIVCQLLGWGEWPGCTENRDATDSHHMQKWKVNITLNLMKKKHEETKTSQI